MLVRLWLGDVNVHALIDSGSTHNLIAMEVSSRTGLSMVCCSSASITIVNGEHVLCTGVYRRAPFSIAGDQFFADFFALPLPEYDVVLGTQSLAMLSPILWDFEAFTMSFWHKDHTVCWLLKKFVGNPPAAPLALPPTHHDATVPGPDRAACTHLVQGVCPVLVHWTGEPGKTSATFLTVIQHCSSRMSCSSRKGEMSCGSDSTSISPGLRCC